MRSETPQNRGRSRARPSSRSSLRRRPRRNQTWNPSNPSQTHSTETSRDQHSPVDRTDSIAAPDPLQQVNHQLLHAYNVLFQRKIIVTQELNLLNQYLETLQPLHSPNKMDWEPIPPTHAHCVQQPQQQQQQSFDAPRLALPEASMQQKPYM
ncbi:hypothetical protein EMCG_02223 [[Emmonsia] crescens]|uniref:Uncharacterized protein n=1 Tax=[Emmonsia] crescens TaxID=73230 RepID=A0A0G2HYV6_9EURO|nr:hypothetical protein EMCG_02223 [Emmonsia crescens UAMH 3008]